MATVRWGGVVLGPGISMSRRLADLDAGASRWAGVRLGALVIWCLRATVMLGATVLLLRVIFSPDSAAPGTIDTDDYAQGMRPRTPSSGQARGESSTLHALLSKHTVRSSSGVHPSDAVLDVDPWIGTGESTAQTAVSSSTAWNERLGNTAPFVGVPFAMTHYTVETQRSTHKCIAPFYSIDTAVTGFRLSHWLSGSCTQDYGSVTVQPVLVPASWSTEKFEQRLRVWLDASSCNDPKNFKQCQLPQHGIDCDSRTACRRFVHLSAQHRVKSPFLQLTTLGESDVIEVAATALERSAALRVRVPKSSTSTEHRLALVFYANARPPATARRRAEATPEFRGQLCQSDGDAGIDQRAALFSAGGGGHSRRACFRLCARQGDGCSHFNFYKSSGFCHMFRECVQRKPAVDGGVTYIMRTDLQDDARASWTVQKNDSLGEVTTLDVGVPVRRIYEEHDQLAGIRGFHHLRIIGGNPTSTGIVSGIQATSWALLPAGDADVLVLSGSSFVSVDGARKNLESDLGKHSLNSLNSIFDNYVAQSKRAWVQHFSSVAIDADQKTRQLVYTALYHSMLAPRTYSDADGTYPQFNGDANQPPTVRHSNWNFYSDFSAWDIYRALAPLLSVLYPKLSESMIRSLVAMGEQNEGYLPIFPCWNSKTGAMIGDHAGVIIADGLMKGVFNFSHGGVEFGRQAAALIVRNALDSDSPSDGRPGLASYIKYGYIPIEDQVLRPGRHSGEQVSRTVEYAFNDAVAADVQDIFGSANSVDILRRRSRNYANLYETDSGYLRSRFANGSFPSTLLDPTTKYKWLTEGTPSHWLFAAAPHDPYGLAKVVGGTELLIRRLDRFFGVQLGDSGVYVDDHKSSHWHGNEPGHHTPYLYVYLGQPWKTQALVRHIALTEYHEGPGGISGNDDAGQMSAWFVWAAFGLYPAIVGLSSPHYVIGSPLSRKTLLKLPYRLPNGNEQTHVFTIVANGLSDEAIYISQAFLDGVRLERAWLGHSELLASSKLLLVMSKTPNRTWGCRLKDLPPVRSPDD